MENINYTQYYNEARKKGAIKCVEVQRHWHIIHYQDYTIEPYRIPVSNMYFKSRGSAIV